MWPCNNISFAEGAKKIKTILSFGSGLTAKGAVTRLLLLGTSESGISSLNLWFLDLAGASGVAAGRTGFLGPFLCWVLCPVLPDERASLRSISAPACLHSPMQRAVMCRSATQILQCHQLPGGGTLFSWMPSSTVISISEQELGGGGEGMVGKGGIKLQPPKDSPTLRNEKND